MFESILHNNWPLADHSVFSSRVENICTALLHYCTVL